MRRPTGFTLIEVLIVMVIISIIGGITLLSISHNQNARFEKVAEQIKEMLALSEERSLIESSVLGLGFTKKTFQVYRYDDNKKPWQALAESLGAHRIPDDMQITVKVHGKVIPPMAETANSQPQLLIATAGNILPFTILIGKAGAKPCFEVQGNADGSLISGTIRG